MILAPQAVKRLIEPEEVAATVAFLLGPDGRAFTGAPVIMDQGWSARERMLRLLGAVQLERARTAASSARPVLTQRLVAHEQAEMAAGGGVAHDLASSACAA